MAKKAKQEEEHTNTERWLVTYADLITLLLAFFIIMYSMSKVDAKKFGEVNAALNAIFEGGGIALAGNTGSSLSLDEVIIPSNSESLAIIRESLEGLRRKLLQEMNGREPPGKLRVGMEARGVVVTIDDAVLFDPGEAELRPETREFLRQVGLVLAELPVAIRVEGHTDDIPIAGGRYPSNWDLSVARAMSVLRFFGGIPGMSPERLSAAGYGEYHPVAANDSVEGRARNRRVELVLMPVPWGEKTAPAGGGRSPGISYAAPTLAEGAPRGHPAAANESSPATEH